MAARRLCRREHRTGRPALTSTDIRVLAVDVEVESDPADVVITSDHGQAEVRPDGRRRRYRRVARESRNLLIIHRPARRIVDRPDEGM